jgi:hypothetical protein
MSSVVDSSGEEGLASLVVVASLVGWWEGEAVVGVVMMAAAAAVVVVVVVVDMVDIVMTMVFAVRMGGGDVRRYAVDELVGVGFVVRKLVRRVNEVLVLVSGQIGS